jgi:hypothetical protein
MNMTLLIVLVLLLGTTGGLSRGQANSAPAEELSSLFALPNCIDNVQSDTTVCSAVLPASMDTKRSKVGDHIFLKVALTTSPPEQLITMLDATIIEVQPAGKGHSILRLRIDRAVSKDGRELPVEVSVLALASQSSVTEWWNYPGIISDRFPRIPEDEQRLPGERKFSEDQRHISPLDATPDLPVHHRMICNKQAKKASGNPCVDLLEARGIYGFKGVMLEPGNSASPADSVLSSRKNLRLRAGTVIVLEVKNLHGPRKS